MVAKQRELKSPCPKNVEKYIAYTVYRYIWAPFY